MLAVIIEKLENFYYEQGTLVSIFFLFFVLSFLIQLYYYAFYYRKAILKKSEIISKNQNQEVPVSVIICARNEAENLKKNLPLILEQDYDDFQVIVIDDRSQDDTEIILNEFATKYPHLVVSHVKNDPKFTHGKKLALLLGIKASSNEWLLMTDADCCPASNKWLYQMQKNFNKDTEIVLGYGGYKKEPGLLNFIVRFETAFNAMVYFGMARAGKPYMGVGRNLAYRKSLFFRNNGFATHTGLSSGDDDLFINETAHKGNTAIEMHPDSFTWSESEKKFIHWIRQKKRHLSTASRYSPGSKFRLIFENLSRVILLISFIVLVAESSLVLFSLVSFLLLYAFKTIIYKIVFTRLNERYLYLPAVIIEPVIPVFYGFLHLGNFIERNRAKWR